MNKLDQKRQEKTDSIKYSLNATEKPDNYVFRLDEEEPQTKTMVKPASVELPDIDALVSEIENVGKSSTTSKSSKKKKGKK